MLWDPLLPGVEVLQARWVRRRSPALWHEAVCVALAAQGSGLLDSQRRRSQALASSLLVIPAGVVHTLEISAPAGLSYQALYVTPERIGELLTDTDVPAALTTFSPQNLTPEHGVVIDWLVWLHRAMAAPDALALEREQALLGSVVAVARHLRRLEPPGPQGDGRQSVTYHRAVRRARDYLHAYACQRITLRDLADVAGLSMYRLARTFRRQVGMSPHAYQVQLRVLAAKRLLREGAGIAETAAGCGFYDQAHLTEAFKRHVGVTPGAYVRGALKPRAARAWSEAGRQTRPRRLPA